MVKPSSTAILCAVVTAVLLVLLISTPSNTPSRLHHRRLKLRHPSSASAGGDKKHDSVPFDPVISEIELRREDRERERQHYSFPSSDHAPAAKAQPEWEDFIDAEDYINDEDRFNVTNRIVLLFPKIDVERVDGFVDVEELTEWNVKQAERETLHRTERDLEVHDKNHDGFVSFKEYEPPGWAKDSDDRSHDMGWWKEDHFNSSDLDGDGLLNRTEFNDFLHPADSKNPKLKQWLCKEEIRERDSDRDGKLNFKEFFHGLFDLIRNYDEESNNSSHQSDNAVDAPAKHLFAKLDQNGDGYLSEEELEPIIGNLHPSEHYYAKQQADYMILQADEDKDGRLSLHEMIEHPYVFYSAIFSDEDDFDYHDEFR
ncbi:hypothetical protein QJS10_CPA10g01434 [Acorus calamus]|uniref:EF-hand domain-containing protein n=1 Tax=Acorus calamus TaxID=4465 RepID=A0AAV9E1F4_ACOCL|nr:hypothetical protein QJS10_CPA10g01434 [Acorus calamus]